MRLQTHASKADYLVTHPVYLSLEFLHRATSLIHLQTHVSKANHFITHPVYLCVSFLFYLSYFMLPHRATFLTRLWTQ